MDSQPVLDARRQPGVVENKEVRQRAHRREGQRRFGRGVPPGSAWCMAEGGVGWSCTDCGVDLARNAADAVPGETTTAEKESTQCDSEVGLETQRERRHLLLPLPILRGHRLPAPGATAAAPRTKWRTRV
jgi:hypothetical protein